MTFKIDSEHWPLLKFFERVVEKKEMRFDERPIDQVYGENGLGTYNVNDVSDRVNLNISQDSKGGLSISGSVVEIVVRVNEETPITITGDMSILLEKAPASVSFKVAKSIVAREFTIRHLKP